MKLAITSFLSLPSGIDNSYRKQDMTTITPLIDENNWTVPKCSGKNILAIIGAVIKLIACDAILLDNSFNTLVPKDALKRYSYKFELTTQIIPS
jgi:hypothetical protein